MRCKWAVSDTWPISDAQVTFHLGGSNRIQRLSDLSSRLFEPPGLYLTSGLLKSPNPHSAPRKNTTHSSEQIFEIASYYASIQFAYPYLAHLCKETRANAPVVEIWRLDGRK